MSQDEARFPLVPTLRTTLAVKGFRHPHCHVTQPLWVEQWREWGIDNSTGQIDALLTAHQDTFQGEKDALLAAGVGCSRLLTDLARENDPNGV